MTADLEDTAHTIFTAWVFLLASAASIVAAVFVVASVWRLVADFMWAVVP